jgi:predicted PurR-regulated permease PerM
MDALPPEHGGGIALALKVLVFFSALHLFESKLLMPKLIGLLGMFLAAPLAAIGRVLIAHYVIRPRRLADSFPAHAPPFLIKTQ